MLQLCRTAKVFLYQLQYGPATCAHPLHQSVESFPKEAHTEFSNFFYLLIKLRSSFRHDRLSFKIAAYSGLRFPRQNSGAIPLATIEARNLSSSVLLKLSIGFRIWGRILQRPRSVNRGEELRSCGGVRSKTTPADANFGI